MNVFRYQALPLFITLVRRAVVLNEMDLKYPKLKTLLPIKPFHCPTVLTEGCPTVLTEGGGGVQWLSGRVLDSRPRGRGLSLTGVTVL